MTVARSLGARAAFVALVVVVLGGFTFAGCLGPAVGEERIASYDVTAVIREDRTVAVREVLDWDFGGSDRHGIFRRIPWAGGAPVDVEVSSETAPDAVDLSTEGDNTVVQVGDPDRTISGRHRYVLTYVLPATIRDGRFYMSAVGSELEVGSEHVTVTVLGAELGDLRCFTGPLGSTERCDVETTADGYRTELDGLGSHEAVTFDGRVVATRAAALPDPPPFVDRDGSARLRWTGIVLGLGAVVAAATFVVCRRLGRNEVAGGGATEAAFAPQGDFGSAPPVPATAPPGHRLVADTQMADLAGLDFAPPRGIEPWQAAVVVREAIDARTIGAWFSGLAAHDVVTFARSPGGTTYLRPGPRADDADPTVAPILNRALGGRTQVELGSYDARFAEAWADAGRAIDAWTIGSAVFRRRPPRHTGADGRDAVANVMLCVVPGLVVTFAGGAGVISGLRSGLAAVAVALGVSAAAALIAFRPLTRGLSAAGSAIALRTESFRRFLHDSEAQHVEWAWQNGLLREYSAWAVALDEADAWNTALTASSVPPAEVTATSGVLYPAMYGSTFSSTTTAPSSSGSGGGGGFSGGGFSGGGFSGGGGGGGGGGSW